MIEDNSEERIEYDVYNSNFVKVTASILRNFLGEYELYSEAENNRLTEEIRHVERA